jgi:hypothetical protein
MTSLDPDNAARRPRAIRWAIASLAVAVIAAIYFLWLDGGGHEYSKGESGLIDLAIGHAMGAAIVLAGLLTAVNSLRLSQTYLALAGLLFNILVAAGVALYIVSAG